VPLNLALFSGADRVRRSVARACETALHIQLGRLRTEMHPAGGARTSDLEHDLLAGLLQRHRR
jgi:hypothetical protein